MAQAKCLIGNKLSKSIGDYGESHTTPTETMMALLRELKKSVSRQLKNIKIEMIELSFEVAHLRSINNKQKS
jgi:hypothetical protein